MKDEYVSVEHVLLALARLKDGAVAEVVPLGRPHVRQGAGSDGGRAGQPARDEPDARGHLRGPREVRTRPHRARPAGQARPGHRPRRGDPPGHPDPLASHQEQPGADRRARRRQDRHRRGPGPAHRAGRRARGAQGQAHRHARHGRAGGRRQVPRRVRGAAQGGAQGGAGVAGPDHPLHRRAAHGGRRGRGRGRHGRQQPAQADAGARRAALHRRDHARRVPQAHREGCRPRAPLPAGHGRPADGRGHHLDPARAAGALRGPPRRADQGRRAGGGGGAVAPLHHRPLPARQGHRPRRRGGGPAADGDRLDAGRAGRDHPPDHCSSRSSATALRKETDAASRDRLAKLEKELAELQAQAARRCASSGSARRRPSSSRASSASASRRSSSRSTRRCAPTT